MTKIHFAGAWLLAVSLGWPAARAAETSALEFGVLPTLSTRQTLATYQPLRDYLQQRLKRPVSLVTAPDYPTYIERTRAGEYRFLVTAPHFARLAQLEQGYVPLVRVQRDLRSIIVVREASGINQIAGLRGKMVSTPQNLAVATMLGLQLLREQGFDLQKDVTVHTASSFNSAILAVQNGESTAAVTVQTALNQMPEAARAGLRVIGTSAPVPHVIYIARRDVPAAERERMTQLLLDFAADATHGAPFFQHTGFVGLVRPSAAEMSALDPYVAELKRQLSPATPAGGSAPAPKAAP
jgi:phosphonate transport system substrate-binding protein